MRVACELNEIAQAQTRRKESTVFIFVAARVKARVSDKKNPQRASVEGSYEGDVPEKFLGGGPS
ncbi:MAG TPA: hypothetical protein VJ248_11440, partial [Candidatus Udaeobacter sp.]|nr:hypothetical protein [Candidatus Udaeobacter sp.]